MQKHLEYRYLSLQSKSRLRTTSRRPNSMSYGETNLHEGSPTANGAIDYKHQQTTDSDRIIHADAQKTNAET